MSKTAAVRHAQRPAEFNFLNITANQLAVCLRQFQNPFPDRLLPTGVFIKASWQLFGAVGQTLVCHFWRNQGKRLFQEIGDKIGFTAHASDLPAGDSLFPQFCF